MSSSVSAVIFTFKRPQYLEEQINSIKNQTIPPDEIIVGHLVNEKTEEFDFSNSNIDNLVKFKKDPGFHAKFITALTAQNDWVAIFDDDTIPGKRWFENCLETRRIKNGGICGAFGMRLNQRIYKRVDRIGIWWESNNNIEEVDAIGHTWFMPYEYINYMWREQPPFKNNAEDLFFAYQAQKYGDIKFYVPPHPPNDLEIWGSTKKDYGFDDNAISIRNMKEHRSLRDEMVEYLIECGWKPIFLR